MAPSITERYSISSNWSAFDNEQEEICPGQLQSNLLKTQVVKSKFENLKTSFFGNGEDKLNLKSKFKDYRNSLTTTTTTTTTKSPEASSEFFDLEAGVDMKEKLIEYRRSLSS